MEAGRYFVAHGPADEREVAAGRPWVAASWLFSVEPRGATRCRLVSRYRANYSEDVATQLAFAPALLEPVGFAMDRRMLIGIKQRAEGRSRARSAGPASKAPRQSGASMPAGG